MLEYIFASVLEVSAAVSAVILFFRYLVPKRLNHYSPKCRTTLWLIFALRLLLPFQYGSGITMLRLIALYSFGESFTAASNSAVQTNTFSLMYALALLWLAGAAVCLFAHLAVYKIYERKMRRGSCFSALSCEEEQEIRAIFDKVKRDLGICGPVELCISAHASGPMLMGFFCPTVVFPDCVLDKGDMEMIFRHELMHYRRRDSWYRLVMLAAVSVHWFNPLVYGMALQSTEDLESACDRSVIAGQGKEFVQAYARSLLSTAKCLIQRKNVRQTVLVSYFSSSAERLKKRFADLFVPAPKRGVPLLLLAMIVIL